MMIINGLDTLISLSVSVPVSLCHSVSLRLSVHIIMSGRQISTMAIVGPSVYLLTREDSLCYNRLISLPPRTLISSRLKIETIIAVGGVTLKHCSTFTTLYPHPKQQSDLGRCSQQWDALTLKDDRQAFIPYYCVILPPSVSSPWTGWMCFIFLCVCVSVFVQTCLTEYT